MPNGKTGDHPYDDIVINDVDLGSPEIANLVRELHRIGDRDIRQLIEELLYFLIPTERTHDSAAQRSRLLKHLQTIQRLSSDRPAQT